MTAKDRLLKFGNSALFPVLILALWQLLSSLGVLYEAVLPSPAKVINAFVEIVKDGSLFVDVEVSVERVLCGTFFGVIIALALGILAGLVPVVERMLRPIVDVVRQISLYAWIPLIILWFGIGEVSKVIIIARGVFIPAYINTVSGIQNIPKEYVELGKVLELSRGTFIRKIVFPSAAPIIFAGLRLAISGAWTAVVAAEMLGGLTGLGYALLHAKEFLQNDRLIALMFVIGILAALSDWVLGLIEKHAFNKWKDNV
jgi:sulfonate transport system permease protein